MAHWCNWRCYPGYHIEPYGKAQAVMMAAAGTPLEQRHEATRHCVRWLIPNPRLGGTAANVAAVIWQAAQSLLELLDDGIELTAGLRKLREAKDCLVIQALEDSGVTATAGVTGSVASGASATAGVTGSAASGTSATAAGNWSSLRAHQ